MHVISFFRDEHENYRYAGNLRTISNLVAERSSATLNVRHVRKKFL
jgi:hypothetical protein